MKVRRKHFEGKPTILVNGRIINGCQNFTLEEAEAIFEKYNVPPKMRQDVYDNYVQVSTPEEILSFVNDEDWTVREAVANQGYGLDILVNDKSFIVRKAVANQGYGLDVLIDDEYWRVREAVANQGYGLDILVKDEHWGVRVAVANQGYRLNVLVNDKEWFVRAEVAKQGYGLDVLINDEHCVARKVAQIKLNELNNQ